MIIYIKKSSYKKLSLGLGNVKSRECSTINIMVQVIQSEKGINLRYIS